jgi:hypothetical protein
MSFIKDIILLISIVILLFNQKKVKSNIHIALGIFILTLSTIGVGYGQNFVLSHLPIIDCLPYKVYNDIVEKMKVPAAAVPDSVSIQMEFIKEGKSYYFDANHFPENFDASYVYKNRREVVVRKGNGLKAAIDDFALETINKVDSTKEILNQTTPYVLIFTGKVTAEVPWENLLAQLHQKHKLIYIVTADKSGALQLLAKENILIGDITMIKTAARVWPTIFVMNGSVIMQKQSYIDFLKK